MPGKDGTMIQVEVVYATSARQLWLTVDVEPGTRVRDAIERSGILQACPEIDLGKQKVGIFAKLTKLDAEVEDGDRIEIYRPISDG